MTSLLAFGRRCHPASSVFLLASSLDFLQGTFEKIHLHRLLGEHSLQLVDLLTVGRRVRAGPRGIFSRLDCLEFNAPLVQASPVTPSSSANSLTSSQLLRRSTAIRWNFREYRFRFTLQPFPCKVCPSWLSHFKGAVHVAHAQTQNLFFQPPTYPGFGQIVTADFDNDGKPDLVAADGTVLLGNGDGTFRQGTLWSITGLAYGAGNIATGDFNGDGKADLLVFSSTFLYVLLGNGDGTFKAAIRTNMGAAASSVIAVDVNGDGKADVLAIGAGELF